MIQQWQHANGNEWTVELDGDTVVAAEWTGLVARGHPLRKEPSTLEYLTMSRREFTVIKER